jgi:nucleoside-diphosphate-sugar epimerase
MAKRAGVRKIVYAGSISSDPALELGLPLNSYGFSKAEAERLLEWGINRTGGTYCSLRLPQLWDTEGACCAHQPWFGRIIAYASRGQLLNMPASDGPRNFMHVSDAAQLLIRAGESTLEGTHAVCYPVDIDMAELARHAYRIFGQGGGIAIDPNKKPFRKMRFPHEESAFKTLEYYPQVSLEQGLRLILEANTADRFGPVDVL